MTAVDQIRGDKGQATFNSARGGARPPRSPPNLSTDNNNCRHSRYEPGCGRKRTGSITRIDRLICPDEGKSVENLNQQGDVTMNDNEKAREKMSKERPKSLESRFVGRLDESYARDSLLRFFLLSIVLAFRQFDEPFREAPSLYTVKSGGE